MSSPKSGYIYKNAPVAEVIAEVLWQLRPILGSNLAYDPFFEDLAESFSSPEFPHIERIVPIEVPRELVSHKPIFRYRAEKNGWPLYQIGPGIFTANIVPPPYEGWPKFFPIISKGVNTLYENYPLAEKHLKPTVLRLVYINAFRQEHGYKNQQEFLREGLNFDIETPPQLSNYIEEGSTSVVSEFTFKLKKLENSSAIIKTGPGSNNGNPALIVENIIYKNVESLKLEREDIETWFSEAHDRNHEIFEAYITETTRQTFGDKIKNDA